MKEKILEEFRETFGENSGLQSIEDFIYQSLDQYADWKIKECLPEKGGYACWECGSDGWDACIDQILSNKDKK